MPASPAMRSFGTGVHDAVDHNAVILETILARLDFMEGKMNVAESVVSQLGLDAKSNDERLDAKLREELNAVTSQLGDELRAEKVKTQEAFVNLKGVALGAVEAARSMATGTMIPPGLLNSAALNAALTQFDGRTTALSSSANA